MNDTIFDKLFPTIAFGGTGIAFVIFIAAFCIQSTALVFVSMGIGCLALLITIALLLVEVWSK